MRLTLIHIYKCGGSSMRQYIRQNLATPTTRIIDQWAEPWELKLKGAFSGNMARAEILRATVPSTGDCIVLAHTFFYEFMKQWRDMRFVTFLRDPVERLLSQYHFERKHLNVTDDLPVWLDKVEHACNLQTIALSGVATTSPNHVHLGQAKANLHWFDFIGLVDQYDESVKAFNRQFGIAGTAERLNESPRTIELSDAMIADVRRRCVFDRALVEYARQLVKAKAMALDLIESGPVVPAAVQP